MREAGRSRIQNLWAVISNNPVPMHWNVQRTWDRAKCISPKDYAVREDFNQELLKAIDARAGSDRTGRFLVVIPPEMIKKYQNRIINIHPSLIPSFCGTGFMD